MHQLNLGWEHLWCHNMSKIFNTKYKAWPYLPTVYMRIVHCSPTVEGEHGKGLGAIL